MLAAMASFVLHGAAMAGAHQHVPASQDCDRTGHVHAQAKGSAHLHADGTAHVHHADGDLGSGDHEPIGDHHADGEEAACCGSLCAVAIAAGAPDTPSIPLAAGSLPLVNQVGSGADLSGLKRPPRTTDIA